MSIDAKRFEKALFMISSFARDQIDVCVREALAGSFAECHGKFKLGQVLAGREVREIRRGV
jgi:predicted trehalose synthase